MTENLCHDLSTGALRHRLGDKVTRLVYKEALAPEHRDTYWLSYEVRLVWKNDRREPVGVRERDKSPLPRCIPSKISDEVEEY
jgi:hypothetical protein